MPEEVGIIVAVKDKASAVFKAIGKTGSAAMAEIKATGTKVGDTLKSIGVGAAILNQGLELAKKGIELFRMAVWDSIVAMQEFREETDPISVAFKQMEQDARFLRGTLGNVLVPIFLGLNDAIKETSGSITDYIQSNKELIAMEIATWLHKIATVLIQGVAKGFLWVSRAVSGLIEVWNLFRAGVEIGFSILFAGFAKIMSGFAKVAEVMGQEGLAGQMRMVADAQKQMSDEFSRSADQSIDKMAAQAAAQKELEAALESLTIGALRFADDAFDAMMKRAKKGWSDLKNEIRGTGDVVKDEVDKSKVAIDELNKKQEEAKRKAIALARAWTNFRKDVITGTISAMGAALTAIVTGSEDAAVAMTNAIIESVKVAVNAYAIAAAAAQAAQGAAIPGIGIAIAAAAATAMLSMVQGLLGQMPKPVKAAGGGIIGSGMFGRDTETVLTQRGEGVLKPGQTNAIMRLADAIEGRGVEGQQGAQRPVTINADLQVQTVKGMDRDTVKEVLLEWAEPLEEMVADGMLLQGLQRV